MPSHRRVLVGTLMAMTALTGCTPSAPGTSSEEAQSLPVSGAHSPTSAQPGDTQTAAPTSSETPANGPTTAGSGSGGLLAVAPGTYGTPVPLIAGGRVLPPIQPDRSMNGSRRDAVTGTSTEPAYSIQKNYFLQVQKSGITALATEEEAWEALNRYCVAWFNNPEAPQDVRVAWIQELMGISPTDFAVSDIDNLPDDFNEWDTPSPYELIPGGFCDPDAPATAETPEGPYSAFSDWPSWQ